MSYRKEQKEADKRLEEMFGKKRKLPLSERVVMWYRWRLTRKMDRLSRKIDKLDRRF